MIETYDVIVVGAGIAGATLAYALGQQGRNVLVIERELTEPDRIVGELLQPGGCMKLKELGMEDCLEGIDAAIVHGYGLIRPNDNYNKQLTYPLHNGTVVKGRSFHHGRFVQKLRSKAKALSNVTMVEAIASKLIEDEVGVIGITYNQKVEPKEKEVYAPLTIICDGCNSNFRPKFKLDKPSSTSHFVGLILEDCVLHYPQHGHVFLVNPGPVLAYQIGTNEIRLLVDVPSPMPSNLVQYLRETTAPQLPEAIRDSFEKALQQQKLKSMPNRRLHGDEDKARRPGVLLLGDSWNMRHPLTGGGMTVAFSDVVIVRDCLAAVKHFDDRKEVFRSLDSFYVTRKPLASTVNILASALYGVFAASDDPILPHMRQACMKYFELGGEAVDGPVGLLGGIRPQPRLLLAHFFSVALYGVYLTLYPFPTPARILRAYQLLGAAAWIVIPLMKGEKVFGVFTTLISLLFALRKPKSLVQKQDKEE